MGKKSQQEPRAGSNKAALDRRLNTSQILTYRWHSLSLGFIIFGAFIVLNTILYVLMDLGGQSRYFGIFSSVRIPNSYDPDVIRRIYYIDGKVIGRLLWPSVVLMATGLIMQILRMLKQRKTVNAAVTKRAKEIKSSM